MPIDIRILQRGDEAVLANVAVDVFDDPVDADTVRAFLDDTRHHLVVALEDVVVIGFISAIHYVHPDKPRPELWINEVAVAATHQGGGVAKAMLGAMLELARDLGCAEAWVLTERGNTPAMRLYSALGGSVDPAETVMFTFRLEAE